MISSSQTSSTGAGSRQTPRHGRAQTQTQTQTRQEEAGNPPKPKANPNPDRQPAGGRFSFGPANFKLAISRAPWSIRPNGHDCIHDPLETGRGTPCRPSQDRQWPSPPGRCRRSSSRRRRSREREREVGKRAPQPLHSSDSSASANASASTRTTAAASSSTRTPPEAPARRFSPRPRRGRRRSQTGQIHHGNCRRNPGEAVAAHPLLERVAGEGHE